ncbi:hypothetical protein [Amycolatopsis sp. NPDC059021]|uniref:hypothetical protein n=1 Tax=Amycolatopsis sp. NPDC059021 TaxID=3346704 RepID=UPI00366DE3D7
MSEDVPIGRKVRGVVAEHHSYGLEVRLMPPDPPVLAFVDVAVISDDRQINGMGDYPPVGSEVDGVTLRYDANGQLRLSLRHSDIGPSEAGR